MFGPQGGEVDILAYFATSVHLDSLALQLWQFEFDGRAGVGGGYFKLQLELIPHQIMGIRAYTLPLDAIG